MRKRITNIAVGVAAVATLALGGAAISQAGSPKPANATKATSHHAKTHHRSKKAHHRTTRSSATEQGSTTDPAGEGGPEDTNAGEVPNNDGPQGHADEPGNPSADHQFEGQE